MKKLNLSDVEETKEFRRPEAGAYICTITNAVDHPKEEYLEIEYDIAIGEFRGYYNDMRERGFDWAGKYRRYYTEKSKPFFKRFCSAVSRSNGNYVFDAGEVNHDERTLLDKSIGLLFQEEKYTGNDGNEKTRLIVNREFEIGKIDKQKVPPLKDSTTPKPRPVSSSIGSDLFVSEGTDEELPFK